MDMIDHTDTSDSFLVQRKHSNFTKTIFRFQQILKRKAWNQENFAIQLQKLLQCFLEVSWEVDYCKSLRQGSKARKEVTKGQKLSVRKNWMPIITGEHN